METAYFEELSRLLVLFDNTFAIQQAEAASFFMAYGRRIDTYLLGIIDFRR